VLSHLLGALPLDRLIFFPERHVQRAPHGVDERWITTADGVRLHAWCAGPADAPATLVWSHGNAGNIGTRAPVLAALATVGLRVVAYDYRGYGRSEGSPSEAGVYRDAEAVWDDVREGGVPPERIVCFGESLGGAVAVRLARVRPSAAVVVVATFTRLADVARAHFGPFGWFAAGRFDSAAQVADIGVPLLAVHGDRDALVPIHLGRALHEAARQPKRFLEVSGADHNDVLAAPGVVAAIAAFARDAVRTA
jgi:pimeloyl-ACP methyl ester carboxylesterase